MIARWRHLVMGTLISLLLVLATAGLSAWPAWQTLPADYALIRLSFTQSGVRNCRDRTPAELAALARNMRAAQICDRRRAPVYVEMDIDGQTLFARDLAPSGLSGSGPSRVYQRFELPAGSYRIDLRLRTDPASPDFTNTESRTLQLTPGQSVAIDYNAEAGGFIFH